ncbi:flagellar assembly protein FliW [Actinotalea sp. C106]|uniref:flagellar assembly protein FliW n=1 Tax=Actinotalea sp. C106 TaxID=2908644 RepID=UPI0020294909|nr:flagellar assembly protein FliW [Actinotalea sp. C106]
MSATVTVGTTATAAPARRSVIASLDFAESMPGMAGLHSFELAPLDDTGFLFALRSTEDTGTRLFVVPPQAYFPEYTPGLSGARESLGTTEDPVLLVVVHPGHDGAAPTANLLAPIAVDPSTGRAVQTLLDGDEWPLRAPLGASSSAA